MRQMQHFWESCWRQQTAFCLKLTGFSLQFWHFSKFSGPRPCKDCNHSCVKLNVFQVRREFTKPGSSRFGVDPIIRTHSASSGRSSLCTSNGNSESNHSDNGPAGGRNNQTYVSCKIGGFQDEDFQLVQPDFYAIHTDHFQSRAVCGIWMVTEWGWPKKTHSKAFCRFVVSLFPKKPGMTSIKNC